jgi:hypothetical protein
MKSNTYTITPANGENAIAAIIASAPPEKQAALERFAYVTRWLLDDARAHGHRPPQNAEELIAAMDAITGFMLAQPASRDVAMETIELVEQLFTNARKFPKALMTKLGKAVKAERQRIAALGTLLSEVASEVSFEVFEEHGNLTRVEIDSLLAVVRGDLQHYDGEVTDPDAFTGWIIGEVDAEIRYREDVRARERMRHAKFVAMHEIGQRAVYDGIWEILKGCFGLGATKQEAEELAQLTWCKIWGDFKAWEADGTASIATRLRAFGHAQALGWRTERLRNRARFRALFHADMSADERRTHEEKRAA